MSAVPYENLSTFEAVQRGIRDAIGMPLLVLLCSMTAFGSLAREGGLTLDIALASTIGVWALPGQIVFVELHATGSEVAALVLAVSLANARFLPMVMSLLPLLRIDLKRVGWLYLYAHLLSAQSWAYCRRVFPRFPANRRRSYFLAFTLSILIISLAGTALGYILTDALPRPLAVALVLVNPLFMLLLLADSRNRAVILALIAGAVVGPLVHPYAPGWGMLFTGVVAGSAGFLANRWLTTRRSS